ncbi:MAG: tail completion protein gp17 [Pseudomonadota bacterium]
MADAIAALVAYLKADAATAAIAGARIFGGELPPDEGAAMPRAAIVLAASGGSSLTGGSYVEHDTQRVDLFAYGATPHAAEQLRDVAAMALRRLRRGVWAQVLVHWVQPAGGSTGARDPDAAWPRAFQSFQIFHALNPVA